MSTGINSFGKVVSSAALVKRNRQSFFLTISSAFLLFVCVFYLNGNWFFFFEYFFLLDKPISPWNFLCDPCTFDTSAITKPPHIHTKIIEKSFLFYLPHITPLLQLIFQQVSGEPRVKIIFADMKVTHARSHAALQLQHRQNAYV